MGQPAARAGDPTSHGTPLSPGTGAMTVRIGGKPAWRVGPDFHTCPLTNGTVPHVGGTVGQGSVTVRIEGAYAARQGDQVVESGGGPNVISGGLPTVRIG